MQIWINGWGNLIKNVIGCTRLTGAVLGLWGIPVTAF